MDTRLSVVHSLKIDNYYPNLFISRLPISLAPRQRILLIAISYDVLIHAEQHLLPYLQQ